MRKICKKIILIILRVLAVRRLAAQTQIIGITGSVGKTTTKEALRQILKKDFRVVASPASYNSEFGVPLTILAEQSGLASPGKWGGILWRGFRKSWQKLVADFLILELGAEKPGDLMQLLKIVQPQIGITLAVAPVHLAQNRFPNLAAIAAEKSLLAQNLPSSGKAILNADDERVRNFRSPAQTIFFSQNYQAAAAVPGTLYATKITENFKGISADILWNKQRAYLNLSILGQHNLTAVLAALATALAVGLNLKQACANLQDFRLPPGRGNLFSGLKGSRILDSSYNANPESTLATLKVLQKLQITGRKIVVLGQMNELGQNAERFHREIGAKAQEVADLVVGVFGAAKILVESVRGKPAYFFADAISAADFLRARLQPGDLILVKGSQNQVRLEKLVLQLLANPRQDQKFLCRQGSEWQF